MQAKRRKWEGLSKVALLGSYIPRRCGIATFTSDLGEAIADVAPGVDTWAVAMNDQPEGYHYPKRVSFEINANRLGEYRLAAEFLNTSQVDVVCVQHEYGIYGGHHPSGAHNGRYILELIRRLRMPVVTTLHTVLRDPNEGQLEVMREIGELSDRVVVMSGRALGFLKDIYGIAQEKIAHIPHGIHETPFVDPAFYKDQFSVEGKKVILTFGLLSPNKGIEFMIDAMPMIVHKHPDAMYIVLGATHPHVKAETGENYRTGLQRQAQEKNVGNNVIFHNRFVETPELMEYLGAADVYVTPYLNETQIVSGTLAYALGAGKATVSTPYWYAQEMLADGRGRLVPFKNPAAIADQVIDLFDNEVQRHAMRKKCYSYTRPFVWSAVAGQYLDLFMAAKAERQKTPKPVYQALPLSDSRPELTQISLDHLRALTDETGVLHVAKCTIPDRRSGYCTDDNAAALIAVLMAQDHVRSDRVLTALASCYLSFLDHALDDETGRFHGGMSYERQWWQQVGSEESHGRAIWALGVAVARSHVRGHRKQATALFHKALPALESFRSPRAMAFALIGIHAYLRRFSGDSQARRVREQLALLLYGRFTSHATDDWPWPEDILSYSNARLPHALLLSGRWMFESSLIETALRSLDWLYRTQTADDGHFTPVGSRGWYPRGGTRARFDQLPLESYGMIDACLEAHRVTQDQSWLERAYRCFNWFLGDNDLHLPLYDQLTGGCYDALSPQGVNENQGAEATLSWLLSLLNLYDQRHEHLLPQVEEEAPPAAQSEAPSVPDADARTDQDEALKEPDESGDSDSDDKPSTLSIEIPPPSEPAGGDGKQSSRRPERRPPTDPASRRHARRP